MDGWQLWGIGILVSLAISVSAFFIKRAFSRKDKERAERDAKWEKEQTELKEQILGELRNFRTENEKRHCKNEEHIKKVEDKLNDTLENLPKVYTLREDWMRFSSSIDRKLDGINDLLIQILRGGKQGNE